MNIFSISSTLLWVVLIFNLLLTLALVRSVNKMSSTYIDGERLKIDTLQPGDTAPNFSALSLGGEEITLKDFNNKTVAFIFVSSKCEPCKTRIPEIEKVFPAAKDAGIEFVFVTNDDFDEANDFFGALNGNIKTLMVPKQNNAFRDEYKIFGTPSFCLVNSKGIIQEIGFFDQKWTSLVMEWVEIAIEKAKITG